MRVQIWKTGDPWFDIGIVGLYCNLKEIEEKVEDEDLPEEVLPFLRLTRQMLEFELNLQATDCLQEEFEQYVADKFNQVFLLPKEWKWLGRSEWQMKGAFLDVSLEKKLTDAEYQWLQKEKKMTPKSRTIQLEKIKNYFGTLSNWKDLTTKYKGEIHAFIQQHLFPSPQNAKPCPLCNRSSKQGFKMRQNRNLFFNQHHATKVRGYSSNVGVQEMCPTCNLLSLYSLIQTQWFPFYQFDNQQKGKTKKQEETDIFFPEVNDLVALYRLMTNLEKRLLNFKHPKIIDYSSNIPSLPNHSLYISLLTIYHWFHEQKDELTMRVYDDTFQQSLKSWIVARYHVGQSVNFYKFYRINVDHTLFQLTDELSYGSKKQQKGKLVDQFFREVRTDDPQCLEQIAEGIVKQDLTLINDGLFAWIKRLKKEPKKQWMSYTAFTFFRDFLSFMLEKVVICLHLELLEDIRALGLVIGKYCARDLSLLTKLNRATSVSSLKQALNEAFFQMVKLVSHAQNDSEPLQQLLHVRAKSLDHILKALTDENVIDIRNTIMLYANLQAFWTIVKAK